jgi:NADPH-dependent glutamate synthase beta subunit-like oxidoreductase/NAD-dependent dihydropyrimidine dehydrogenase PreA subunit
MTVQRIDLELCNGCGICVNSCSVDVLRLDTVVAKKEEFPPCRLACPVGVDMRRYIHLLQDGMTEEALGVIRETLPLPAITGRICPHPCESECVRNEIDEAVNISSLERFAADVDLQEKARPARKIYTAKVAIIGSGPAGLAAAYELTKMGYPVTVFEAMPMLGGMLRVGVPDYRLPKNVLDAQINYIRDTGVEFKTNITMGRNLTLEDLKKQGYQAIFLALGAQLSRKLDISGTELSGVYWGLDFLKEVNLKRKVNIKDKVLVIGGGNVAVDVALTTLRLGAKEVQMACLESREQMPAYKEEIQQALDEGITLHPSWGPKRILGNGEKVNRVELLKCLSVFDKSGKFNPSYDGKISQTIQTDMVILAIGQVSDLSLVPQGIKATRTGFIQVDPLTLETTLPGIFAGGDIASALGIAVEAIAAGKKASISIDRYLKGENLKANRDQRPRRVSNLPKVSLEELSRQTTPLLAVVQRRLNFKEVKTGFNEDAMILESRRCTTCGSRAVIRYPEECMACDSCERNCPQNAIYVSPERNMPLMVGWR